MQTHRHRGKSCWNDLPAERARAVWFIVPSSAWAFFRSAGTSSWLDGLTWISWSRWRRRWRVPAATTKTRTTKWAARLKTEVSLTLPSESQMAPRASSTRQKGGRRLCRKNRRNDPSWLSSRTDWLRHHQGPCLYKLLPAIDTPRKTEMFFLIIDICLLEGKKNMAPGKEN